MTTEDIIDSWAWRIKKTKLKQAEFAELVGCKGSEISQYINKRITPSLPRYEAIENKLKDLGV